MPKLDIFSSSPLPGKKKEDEEDLSVVIDDTPKSEAPPEIEPIPTIERSAPVFAGGVMKPSLDTVQAVGQGGLSIASSIAGFTLGAVNVGAGLAKNLYDVTASGLGTLVTAPFGGDEYDKASRMLIEDLEAIPRDMMNDYNQIADILFYDPSNEQTSRFVTNLGEAFHTARETVGDIGAGIPRDADSAVEIEALSQLTPVDKTLGAIGQASVDVALLGVGSLFFRAKSPGKLPTGDPVTVHGVSEIKLPLQAFDKLKNSKPRFASYEEGVARIDALSKGKAKSQIIVETVEGLPTEVIAGQDMILALRELNSRGGVNIREVKVRTIERNAVNWMGFDEAAAKLASKAFAADEAAAAAIHSTIKRGMIDKFTRAVLDTAGNVKRTLEAAGPIGVAAVKNFELAAGATPRAAMIMQDAWHNIYKGLSDRAGTGKAVLGEVIKTERALFERVVRAQRIIAIERSKLGKGKSVRFEAGTTGYQMAHWLQALKQSISREQYAELAVRTGELFKVSAGQLKKLLDEGLISQIEYNKMKGINYLKTEFLDRLDPVTTQQLGGVTVSVGESGIQSIKRGSTKGALLDSESLLHELIVRTENRIARNRANQKLWELANTDPKNNVVTPAKIGKDGKVVDPPSGFAVVNAMVKGKKQSMYMPQWLADEWKVSDPGISAAVANVARIVSGSVIVRPLATGYNPGFVLTNLPRDIVHIWLAAEKTYSKWPLIYAAQMTADLTAVMKDSLFKTGRYRDYINEGGGMNFLTHQGRDVIATSRGAINIRHRPKLKLIRDSLSYANEWSEIVTRLAVRERVLKNQKAQGLPLDPTEATWAARRYLDFSQGGSVIKAFDNFVPYLNATTQAYRTVVRSAKKNPVDFSIRALHLAGVYAGLEAYNMLFNPDAHQQIPERLRRMNFVFHSGNYIIDDDGNKRYEYYRIKKDQSTILPTVWLEQLVDHYITGKPPTDGTFDYITETLPGLSNLIPSIAAMNTYMADYNIWYDKNIYGRDQNVEDYAKFKGYPGTPTDPLFKDLGELFNAKPQALQEATKQIIPTNAFLQMGGLAYQYMFGSVDPVAESLSTQERMTRTPLVNRVYGLTHPAAVALDDLDRGARKLNTIKELQEKHLDETLFHASRSKDYSEAREYARSFMNEDPFLAKTFINRVEASRRLDNTFGKRKIELGDLPKSWWLRMLVEQPKVRADVYYEEWAAASPARKRWMDSLASELTAGELNFREQEFSYELSRLKNQRNSQEITLD